VIGWAIWALLTLLALAASYVLACAAYGDRPTGDRAVVTLLIAHVLILTPLLVLGLLGLLRAPLLAPACVVLFGVAATLGLRHAGKARMAERLRADLAAPRRLFAQAWHEREPMVAALALGAAAFGVSILLVWIFRSWNYDGTVYHVPLTAHFIQDGRVLDLDTHSPWIGGYPFNLELLAVWNCIFQRDNRLDDAPQLSFALLGAAVVAAWVRRLGGSRPLAAGLGASFLVLPPVLLQMSSNQVDIACAALLTTAAYFMSFGNQRRDRWMALLAFGMYAGTKFTGLLHLLLLSPWLIGRLSLEIARTERKLRTAADMLLSIGALAGLSAWKYLDNAVKWGNPTYPFSLTVPLLDKTLPGYIDATRVYGAPPGSTGTFWAAPGDFRRMIASWMDSAPQLWPDVRTGGFGPAFRYLLLWCALLVAVRAFFPGQFRRVLPVGVLFVAALVVPAASWPRYTLAAASAALIAFAIVHEWARVRWLQRLGTALLVGLVAAGAYAVPKNLWKDREFYMWPAHFEPLLRAATEERRTAQVVNWLWPADWAARRETELRSGDVVVYDESADFISEYFTHDYRTNVGFVSSAGHAGDYLQRVLGRRARWIGVTAGSEAEAALLGAGAELLFAAPRTSSVIYRWSDP
jgi:hypothetical protein